MAQVQRQGRTTTGAVNAPQFDSSTATNAATKTVQSSAKIAQSAASGALPLLDRLNAFSGKAVEHGTGIMVQQAKEQAVVDVSKGELSLVEDGTIYGRAYDSSGKTAYISSTTTDIKSTVDMLAAQNKYSPQGFEAAWKQQSRAYSKSSKEVDSNGYVDAVVSDVAKQYGDAAYTKIAANLATKQRELQIKENEEALVLLEDEYIAAVTNGNENGIATALTNMRATLSSMYQTGQIGEQGIETKWKLLNKRVLTSVVQNEFASKMQAGEGAEYIASFRENAKNHPNFKAATPDDINKLMDDMYSTLNKKHSFEDSEIKRAEDIKERKSVQLKEDMDEAWIAGTLKVSDVDSALESGLITPAEHKAYSTKVFDTGAKFTDTGVALKITQNMAALSVQDIMEAENVTNKDKMQFIKQLRTYKHSEEGKWTSTINGRAALNLLKNKFNISQASMLAKLTKEGDVKDYAKVYQQFMLEMEDLDPAKRESRAMHYAQAALDVVEAEKIEEAARNNDANAQKDYDELDSQVKSYQRQVGRKKSAYYVKGLAEFSSRFGLTGDVKFSIRNWDKDL